MLATTKHKIKLIRKVEISLIVLSVILLSFLCFRVFIQGKIRGPWARYPYYRLGLPLENEETEIIIK